MSVRIAANWPISERGRSAPCQTSRRQRTISPGRIYVAPRRARRSTPCFERGEKLMSGQILSSDGRTHLVHGTRCLCGVASGLASRRWIAPTSFVILSSRTGSRQKPLVHIRLASSVGSTGDRRKSPSDFFREFFDLIRLTQDSFVTVSVDEPHQSHSRLRTLTGCLAGAEYRRRKGLRASEVDIKHCKIDLGVMANLTASLMQLAIPIT